MRYIVYGAGAVGGVTGAQLFRHGHEVVLIARGDHLSVIRRLGLTLESPNGSVTLRISAVGHPSEITFRRSDDVVLLTTKCQDSPTALGDLRTAAGAEIPIVCLQNGIEGARMALRRFERVYGAVVMVPSAHLEPGVVQAFSHPVPGVLDVGCFPAGEDPLVVAVSADLAHAGFDSKVRSDIQRWQYGKLLRNLRNAVQALCGPDADYQDLWRELREEGESCCRAANIAWASESELRSRTRGILNLGRIGGQRRKGGSSWQSLARSTGSIETDYLNGEITFLGRLHGVPTPLNSRLQDLAGEAAQQHRPPGSLSVAGLRRLLHSPAT